MKSRREFELERRVCGWISENGLISSGCTVVSGLSGGADSVAMTLLLSSVSSRLGFRLVAAHVNHGIRGAEADRDEAFCRKLCAGRGIEFVAFHGSAPSLAQSEGRSLEDAARELRYRFLRSVSADARIAVAHTLDDNLETVLWHMCRGGGARGMAGIPVKNGDVIRPVMCLSRAETEELCEIYGSGYVTDSTNLTDDCVRNVLRHSVVPVLKELNPAVADHALFTGELLRSEDEYLDSLAAEKLETAGGHITSSLLESSGKALSMRMIRAAAKKAGTEPDGRQTAEIYRAALKKDGRFVLSVTGGQARGEYGRLEFVPEGESAEPDRREYPLFPGGTVHAGKWTVKCIEHSEINQNIYKKFNIFTLPCDKIKDGLIIRNVLPGDTFRKNEKSGTKRLMRIFSDMKLPMRVRKEIPVAADSTGVLFVPGLGTNFGRADSAVPAADVVFIPADDTDI